MRSTRWQPSVLEAQNAGLSLADCGNILLKGGNRLSISAATLATSAVPVEPEPTERRTFRTQPQSDLSELQTILKDAGFYKSSIDGLYGPGMEAAISAWQKKQSVSQTGYLTPAQIVVVKQQQATNQAAASPTPSTYTPTAATLAAKPSDDPTAGLRVIGNKAQLRDKYTQRVGNLEAERLFMGNDSDILLFTNEQAQAPHFVRRVTGDGVFRDNKMTVCGVGNARSMDDVFARYATRTLLKANPGITPQSQMPWTNSCSSMSANSEDDVLAVLRSDLINYPALQEQLITALADRKLRWFNQIDRSPFDILLAQRSANERLLTAQLKAGKLDGVGLLATRTANTAVCAVRAEDAEYVKRAVADINLGILVDKKPGEDAKIYSADIDDVFVFTKRDQCGFVFGDGATLKMMSDAFERDGFVVSLVPVIVPKDKADALLAQLQTERAVSASRVSNDQTEQARLAQEALKRQAEQQAAELQRQSQRQVTLEQQQKLDEVRKQNDETARREELERIRKVVASRGRALQDVLDTRIRRHIGSVVQEVNETKRRAKLRQVLTEQQQAELTSRYETERLDGQFATWSQIISRNVKEEWEFGDIKASLEDYGQAKWRGRNIEAISVRVEFPMTNAVIGERMTGCTVFTWINDEEFRFWRQTASAACNAYDADFRTWAVANQFTSQWKLAPR